MKLALLLAILISQPTHNFSVCTPSIQDNFPDIPKNHWVFGDLADLKKVGLLEQYYTGLGSYRPPTGYEIAVMVHQSEVKLKDVVGATWKSSQNDGSTLTGVNRKSIRDMITWPKYCDELLALTDVFGPRLAKLDVNVKAFLAEIRGTKIQLQGLIARLPGFPDVPKDHWAYKAVEELREAGILVGYPDGKLQG